MLIEGLSFSLLFNTVIRCHYPYLCKFWSLKEKKKKIDNISTLQTIFFKF